MLFRSNAMKQQEMSSQNTVNSENSKTASVDVGALTSCSSVSMCKEIKTHTQFFLAKKRQVRCIRCSRVRLIERKTTMICKECGKGFCRDSLGLGCWSHHICFGGVPVAPVKGTRKMKVAEAIIEEEWKQLEEGM